MREIVLDTETTGLDPKLGDRLVEIAGIELVNSIATGRHYHVYINPERDMPEGAFKVHGLSAEFLVGHPVFALHVEAFLAFVEGAQLVIHNAEFDMRFINHELGTLGRLPIPMDRVVDTLAMARRRHPRRTELARRALRPLPDRHVEARQAWRSRRRGTPGRGLCGTLRWPADEPRAGDADERRTQRGGNAARPVRPAAAGADGCRIRGACKFRRDPRPRRPVAPLRRQGGCGGLRRQP